VLQAELRFLRRSRDRSSVGGLRRRVVVALMLLLLLLLLGL
jgi:hypothetical protein